MNGYRTTRVHSVCGWTSLILVCLSTLLIAAEPASSPAVSEYAPLGDLQHQVSFFMKRLEKDLADEADYGEDQQGRVGKDASSLAAIGLLLGKHDKDHPNKKSASGIVAAAASLADEAEDYASAKAQLAKVKAALASEKEGEALEWEPVASLAYLMQQVPIINNSLRRGVTGRRFKREADKSAGYAATLAAIAQASMFDTDYCVDEADEKKWRQICVDMRDASAAVSKAVRAGDQKTAEMHLGKLVETCDACHHAFRD